MIHAGAAANTAQCWLQSGSKNFRTAAVDQNDVGLAGSFVFICVARTGQE
jgi:hypothetical protein